MSVQKQLPAAIAVAWMMITPAVAADQLLLPWPVTISEPTPTYGYGQPPRSQPFWPSRGIDWRGFYVGGQFAYSDATANFSGATQAPIAYNLRESTLENEFTPSNWPVLGTASHGAPGFGGFVGYNFEYLTESAKIVFGIEANYDQASLSVTAPNSPISRITPADSGGNNYLVHITGSGAMTDLDFGTLRARAAWALGNFLPYAFAGGALGRANVNITETVSGEQNPPSSGACSSASTPACVPFSFSGSAGKNSEFLYGLTVGAGFDVALTQNIFLRAEYEHVQFEAVANTNIWVDTVRAGAGIKF